MHWDGIMNLVDNVIIFTLTIAGIWLACALILKYKSNIDEEENNFGVKEGDIVRLIIEDKDAIEQIEILQCRQDAINNHIIALKDTINIQKDRLLHVNNSLKNCMTSERDKLYNTMVILRQAIAKNEEKITELVEKSNKLTREIRNIMYDNASRVIMKGDNNE